MCRLTRPGGRQQRWLAAGVLGACGLLAAAAVTAESAVRQSTYRVQDVRQTSNFTAVGTTPLGAFTYRAMTTWRAVGNNETITVGFLPARRAGRAGTAGLSYRNGRQRINTAFTEPAQPGQVPDRFTCSVTGAIVPGRVALDVLFTRNRARMNVQITGPDALAVFRDACRTSQVRLFTIPDTAAKQGRDEVTFTVSTAQLRQQFRGRRRLVVLVGTTRTPIAIGGVRLGQMVVRTVVRLRLVGSRQT